jgi:hypothetical protein
MNKFLLFIATLFLVACFGTASVKVDAEQQEKHTPTTPEFNAYWYAGKAELTHYALEQARYGEMRKGDAVTVFVTEPFSKEKQVKLDDANANPKDAVSVLKLNLTKKFDTGIYPYSVMTSVFTPVEQGNRALKVTSTVQEWCGHVFSQINWRKNQYEATSFSYFESEGDRKENIGNALSEDGLWSAVRLNPNALPTGKQKVFPSLTYLRLKHKPMAALEAELSLSDVTFNNKNLIKYNIKYTDRTLSIYFEKTFPHVIEGWEETYKDGKNDLTTRGIRKKTIFSDYWAHNTNADDAMRKAFYE